MALDAAGQTYALARQDEAAREGQSAVVRDEQGNLNVTFRDPTSRSDIAYNRAAQTAYLARMGAEIRLRATELRNEADGDATAFEASYNGFQKELLNKIGKHNPGLKGPVTTLLEQHFSSLQRGVLDQAHGTQLKEYQSTILAEIRTLDDEMTALAAKGATDSAEYRQAQEGVGALFKELADNPQFALSAREAELKMQRMSARHQAEAVVGQVERIYAQNGLAAANKAIKDMFESPDLALSARERRTYSGIARQRIRGIRSERQAELEPLKVQAKTLRGDIEAGKVYDDDDVDALAQSLAKLGDVNGSLRLLRSRAEARELSEFRQLPDDAQREALAKATGRTAASPTGSFVDRVESVESAGDPTARNPRSTATGAGQFIESTWLNVIKQHRPDLASGRSDDELLEMRNDRELSREMIQAYRNDNAAALQKSGIEVSGGTLYLAHFLGAGGATQVLKANASTPIEDIVGDRVVNANPFLKGMSAGDVAMWADRKMGRTVPGRGSNSKVVKRMRKEVASDAKRILSDLKAGIASGLAPGSDNIAGLVQSIELLGDADLSRELTASLEDLQALAPFADLPPIQQQDQLDEAQATQAIDGPDTDGVDLVASMRKIHTRTVDQLKSDPIGLAIERGIPGIAELNEPIDFSNADTLGDSLRNRSVMAKRVAAYYGKPDVLPLRPEEVTALRGSLENATAAEQSQIFGAISENLSGLEYQRTIAALAKKGASRVTAVAGALHSADPMLSESILRGNALLREEPRLAPKESDRAYITRLDQTLPMTVFAPGMQAPWNDYVDSARARYADLSAQAGDTSQNLNRSRMEHAFADVTGGILEMNGSKFIAPVHGMSQASFKDLMGKLVDTDLAGAVFQDGTAITLDSVMDNARLKSHGPGRYLLAYGSQDAEAYAMDKRSGQAFVLDLNPLVTRGIDLGGT
ncbi:MAG: hypothetical protein AAF441_22000 [Pseudomonadota bacterium]